MSTTVGYGVVVLIALLTGEADEDVVQRRLRDGIVDHVTDAPGRFHADEHGGHGQGARLDVPHQMAVASLPQTSLGQHGLHSFQHPIHRVLLAPHVDHVAVAEPAPISDVVRVRRVRGEEQSTHRFLRCCGDPRHLSVPLTMMASRVHST